MVKFSPSKAKADKSALPPSTKVKPPSAVATKPFTQIVKRIYFAISRVTTDAFEGDKFCALGTKAVTIQFLNDYCVKKNKDWNGDTNAGSFDEMRWIEMSRASAAQFGSNTNSVQEHLRAINGDVHGKPNYGFTALEAWVETSNDTSNLVNALHRFGQANNIVVEATACHERKMRENNGEYPFLHACVRQVTIGIKLKRGQEHEESDLAKVSQDEIEIIFIQPGPETEKMMENLCVCADLINEVSSPYQGQICPQSCVPGDMWGINDAYTIIPGVSYNSVRNMLDNFGVTTELALYEENETVETGVEPDTVETNVFSADSLPAPESPA
jgi:hypothetical protein